MKAGWILCLLIWALDAVAREPLPHWYQPGEANTIKVFKAISPAVVNISKVQVRSGFFSFNAVEVPAGSGSGFIWNEQGYIVTNYHVVEGASKLVASFKNGKNSRAKLVGVAPKKDIAVLKVGLPTGLKSIGERIADSREVVPGQKAIAIGSPFGLDQTLTVGTVSALGRSIPGIGGVTIRDMIQTDASINPGNSGGPLLDSRGHLIGMNTVIFSKSGSSAGIGFAVPSATIKRAVNQIIKFGRVRQPGIGISAVPDHLAERWGVKGVILLEVSPRGPAARAGLRGSRQDAYGEVVLGDRIVKVNDSKIQNYDDLYNALESKDIGETVEVGYMRDGKLRKARLKLIDIGAL